MGGQRTRDGIGSVRRRGLAPRLTLILLCAAVTTVVVGMVTLSLIKQHERILVEATLATEKEAGMLAEYTGRMLGAVDVVLEGVVGTLEAEDHAPVGPAVVLRPLAEALAALPQVRSFGVYDTAGQPIFVWPSDRAVYPGTVRRIGAVHRALSPDGPYVSTPHTPVARDPLAILLSRHFNRPDGSYGGVIIAEVDIGEIQALRTPLTIDEGTALALWSDTGEVLVHYPAADPLIRDQNESAVFSGPMASATVTIDSDRPNGAHALLSFRRVPGLPLTALSALDRDHAMAEWRVVLRNHTLAVCAVVATLVSLTVLLLGQMARRQRGDDRLRAAIAAGMDAFFMLRSERNESGQLVDFILEDMNARGERLLLGQRESLIGRRVSTLVSVEHPDRFMAKLRAVAESGRPMEQELTVTEGPKGPMYLHHQIVPLGDGVAITARNVTRQKRVEAELRAAKEAAEAASRAKSDFLANMSHELRTPLNAIIGFSETMLLGYFGPISQKQHGYIKSIHDAGGHLLDVINDLLDLSKIEAGKAELTEEVLDLETELNSAIALVQVQASEKRLTVETATVAPGVQLRGDALKLKQVLINLLSNAIKFTMPGGTVTVSAGWRSDEQFAIAVADTGIGIAAADMAKAMTPFGQVEQAYVRTQGGTGLGLPLAKSLVEMHGGSLGLESTLGVGTVVTVILPAHRVVAAPSLPAMPLIRYAS
jgi:signal transduction histidine kinase